MTDPKVIIVDYGVGNLFNVQRAFQIIGIQAEISKDAGRIRQADRLLLPGVGAFETGMKHLAEYGLLQPVIEFARSGKPLLGICLGMQLLMSESEENGSHTGLDLVKGRVLRLNRPEGSLLPKIPHIGWNSLAFTNGKDRGGSSTLLEGVGENPFYYFVHSYGVFPEKRAHWLTSTRYGENEFCSVLHADNITGCQFHPERSGEFGLRILKNFVLEKR